MKTQLIIPKKIKVGFNLRGDTYTGKLGYVIYHDGKVWRKETSWEGWRQKEGQKIHDGYELDENGQYPKDANGNNIYTQKFKTITDVNPIECDNVPTEGFVLNKKVGGYKSDWNMRQTYSRVFDPRGFEFEISIPNLLYILQETNSIKGKGLEGEFVYAWDGKDLVLLPTCSPDYQSCMNFTKIQSNKVSSKSLIPGASYMTKKEENYIYLGKLNWYPFDYIKPKNGDGRLSKYSLKESKEEKLHMFVDKNNKLQVQSSLSNISNVVSDTPVDNYAELIENFKKNKYAHKIVGIEERAEELKIPEINENIYSSLNFEGFWFKKISDNRYLKYSITRNVDRKYDHKTNKYINTPLGFTLYHDYEIIFDGKLTQKTVEKIQSNSSRYSYGGGRPTTSCNGIPELLNMNLKNLYVKFDDGNEMDYKTYVGGY